MENVIDIPFEDYEEVVIVTRIGVGKVATTTLKNSNSAIEQYKAIEEVTEKAVILLDVANRTKEQKGER